MTGPAPGGGGAGPHDSGRRRGTVGEFDEVVGLGYIDMAGGTAPAGARLRFHCTQIADGSRTIPTGTTVSFAVIAGRGGEWEAGDVRPEPV